MAVFEFKETPTMRRIKELAAKIPAPLSWLVPDPYDPASYIMPIGGVSKVGDLTKRLAEKQLERLAKKQGVSSEFLEKFLRTKKVPIPDDILTFPKESGPRLVPKLTTVDKLSMELQKARFNTPEKAIAKLKSVADAGYNIDYQNIIKDAETGMWRIYNTSVFNPNPLIPVK